MAGDFDALRARTKRFAFDVIDLVKGMPRNLAADAIARQLIKSGTSVSANHRAAGRARSRREFIARLGVVVEEIDESELWLEALLKCGLAPGPVTERLYREACELRAIFVQSLSTAKRRLRARTVSAIAAPLVASLFFVPSLLSSSAPPLLSSPVPQFLVSSVPQLPNSPVPQFLSSPVPQLLSSPVPQFLSSPVPQLLISPVPQLLISPVPQFPISPALHVLNSQVPQLSTDRLDTSSPIPYFIADGSGRVGYRPADQELARWAIERWQQQAGGALQFVPSAESSALVRVYWANARDGQYGEMRTLVVGGKRGAAVYVRPDTDALGLEIARRARADDLLRETIVYLTCLHELGHALGLRHTADFDDIMYFFGFGGDIVHYFDRFRRQLRTRSDIARVSALSDADIARLTALYSIDDQRGR